MSALIAIEDLPVTDRVELLREHMLRAPVPLELRPYPGVELRARSRVADLGRVHVLTSLGTGATVVRSERLARDGTEPRAVLTLLAAGRTCDHQDGRTARLRPGALVLHRTSAPYWATFPHRTLRVSFQLPLAALQLPEGLVRALTATPIEAEPAVAEVVVGHLARVARTAAALTPDSRAALERPTVDLVRLLLASHAGRVDLARDAQAESLRTRLFEYARLHLADPGLGAPMIAAAMGISERYVYALARDSGVSLGDWIRRERVDAAADLLARPGAARVGIATVAHRLGFADHSHFTRTFRAVRGQTPSQWRRSALAAGAAEDAGAAGAAQAVRGR